ncbi:hypothetical protein BKA00_004749 [Actinomadura coerulea]|uniref:DUF397 domain-containing protein n=1 Tax=Actinomadura coerulea TaxID=46159 RepID=A0A7X0G1S3_9ACTN|nr:DUF397 domain-containing protein [Actinomadura coerulea]MBB6397835.1 hypothetical protein [Actinomadura coerulea]
MSTGSAAAGQMQLSMQGAGMSFQGTPSARWRKSTRCASNGCVEVARRVEGTVSVRDTEDTATILSFRSDEWRRFTEDAKDGRFDHPLK